MNMKQFSAITNKLLMLFVLFALTATAVSAQDMHKRGGDDDGPQPEEGNISGSQENISGMLQHSVADLGAVGGSENPSESEDGSDNLGNGSLRGVALKDLGIETFPNPASSYLIIKFPEAIEVKVNLIDILGRSVYEYQGTVYRQLRVEVADELPGIYFVNIQSGDDRLTRKVKVLH
jgi:hypothetical protein